jgi:hypothetical protein
METGVINRASGLQLHARMVFEGALGPATVLQHGSVDAQ